MSNVQSISIVARRWFQKSYGNTYHSVRVYVTTDTGNMLLKCDFEYGYGEQYLKTAHELLAARGLVSVNYSEFYDEWLRYKGTPAQCKAAVDCIDVQRKKDL